jgi:simple sugar transport system permease protein
MRTLLRRQSRPLSAAAAFLLMMAVFVAAKPSVFTDTRIYVAVFQSLPFAIIVAVPLVFMIASGETDLSFPAVFGLGGLAFALAVVAGWPLPMCALAAALAGALAGVVNGVLVTRLRLSSLVATLGMNFLVRGVILVATDGWQVPLPSVAGSTFARAVVGRIGGLPVQMVWGALAAIVGWFLFARHSFGSQVCCAGDNAESAREIGIDVARIKMLAYVYCGTSAALAGVMAATLNYTFYPLSGDGYLLSMLAAVFVGGTPAWGGVGTIIGAVIGATTVSFIETGIVAIGLTGLWTKVFYGLVIVLSMIGHSFSQRRLR